MSGAGALLRDWRERRRLSQLELALDAEVSTRHLSFVETGRSQPGRDVLLRLAARLDLPFRERNELLLAAGHAPEFPERPLTDPGLAPVRAAIDRLLEGHEPFPAMVLDREWNVVRANSGFLAMGRWVDPELLGPPANALRIGLHPRGLAPLTLNLADVRSTFLARLRRQVANSSDETLSALLEEVEAYPDPPGGATSPEDDAAREILTPLRIRTPEGTELSLLGTVSSFGFAGDVTSSELSIEALFPADASTGEAIRSLVGP